MIIFFQIFPYGPPYGFFIHPLIPQRKQEKLAKMSLWPKCHFDQSVTLTKVSLAKVSPAKVTLAKVSLRPKCLWPMCLWPKGHSGQSVILAKVSFWPKCN
jgi:hypothetical protein